MLYSVLTNYEHTSNGHSLGHASPLKQYNIQVVLHACETGLE